MKGVRYPKVISPPLTRHKMRDIAKLKALVRNERALRSVVK